MNQQMINDLEKAYGLIIQANKDMIYVWYHQILFTWRWWLSLVFTIVPWAAWIVKRRKDSTNRLLYAGVITILISSWLDVVGILFGLWSYHAEVIPLSPAFIPWDFTLLPVITMAFLQYKPMVNPLVKAVIFSLIGSFGAQPLFVVLGYYSPKHWHHYYSFPIFFGIYLVAHFVVTRDNFKRL
ncbi:hypothetical protein Desaci_3114 [Desulfosporosinus acidiphilus SJ4]|uniref:Uncharacterized protein n=1 Tax=Desulfosporosinus acidiphilus (strain DSM 22704 / JCM 16185 / SJ4) TaxID=646529 RepID=I4D895_DESAJ|nr:CBO0543 family protein [Desulfosporosinus acidiphilus]AFM42019.1 hypothetical protein Desaci_3114 [Desulfosporosinus acidiphilus SJ4]